MTSGTEVPAKRDFRQELSTRSDEEGRFLRGRVTDAAGQPAAAGLVVSIGPADVDG